MSTPPALAGTPDSGRLGRLRRDRALLAERYPNLAFEIDDKSNTARAVGPLMIELPDGTTDCIQVRLEFGPTYPHQPPRPYDHAGRWKPEADRHIEPDGHFCLFLRGVDAPDMNPVEAILDLVRELEQFLRQQIVFDSQRKFNSQARFPGPEWPHGRVAYELFIVRLLQQEPAEVRSAIWDAARRSWDRRGACPCGSGRLYGDCHFRPSKKLRRSAREADLYELSYERLIEDTRDYA